MWSAKIYSKNPNLGDEVKRCLGKFVEFSMGNKFQYLNAEMLRKFIKKQSRHHKKLFEDSYAILRVRSKKCYIVTYCYGEPHPILDLLRKFKFSLDDNKWGSYLVEGYYRISPQIVNYCERHPNQGRALTLFIFKPIIRVATLIIGRFMR